MNNIETSDLNQLTILWFASEYNLPLREEIEDKLQKLMVTNKRFSREVLFELNFVYKRVIAVHFIPTSNAFKEYGAFVTMRKLLDIEEIKQNYENKIETFGCIKASGFVSEGLESRDLEMSFLTNEILEIERR